MSNVSSLIYVPILHTQHETGNIIASLSDNKKPQVTKKNSSDQKKSIEEMWVGIYDKIKKIGLPYPLVRIYQDALPVCGMEKKIIKKLADRGSRNHKLILELMRNGSKLEGTENSDLLVEEYSYLERLIASVSDSSQSYRRGVNEYRLKSLKLMKQRDSFIAERIKSTLKPGEIPLIFMGVRHNLEKLLRPHFVITHIIYRLPFKKIGDIYNV
jgi:hypothetical protein